MMALPEAVMKNSDMLYFIMVYFQIACNRNSVKCYFLFHFLLSLL